MNPLPRSLLFDLAGILALTFEDDGLHPNADRLMKKVDEERVSVSVSDPTPYEAEAHFRSGKSGRPTAAWSVLMSRLWQDPLFPRLPVTPRVHEEHLNYYNGARGKLSYFDSYRAAASKVSGMPLVTSDGDLLSEPTISTIDLKRI